MVERNWLAEEGLQAKDSRDELKPYITFFSKYIHVLSTVFFFFRILVIGFASRYLFFIY